MGSAPVSTARRCFFKDMHLRDTLVAVKHSKLQVAKLFLLDTELLFGGCHSEARSVSLFAFSRIFLRPYIIEDMLFHLPVYAERSDC